MKKHQPSPSPQFNPEELYAKVNKPQRDQRSQSEPEVLYAQVKRPERGQRPHSIPENNPYAPQKPSNPENAYAVPRSGLKPTPLVSPYAVTDLLGAEGRPDFQRLENPLYEGAEGHHPRPLSEHLYAELDFSRQSGQRPAQPVESVYATVGKGNGGPDADHRENLIYQGVEKGRRTPPPRTPQDEVTSKLAQNVNFQYGVAEVQEWCKVVYGNQHALNNQLAKILENPRQGEKILRDLLENPEGPGKLAGQKLFGVKSPARREAEDGFRPLCEAFERHMRITANTHKDLTKNLERGQGSPERQEHKPHHRHHQHHDRGREQSAHQQEQQRSRSPSPKGMAYAM
ncbi:BID domain-containing T4SS effector [Bartonella vinsonii]|uniref:Protein involved in cell division n=1 Tax=Bartonella vinsonii TaxID=33047 RepID=A0A3S5C0U8_BARVI|nr:BID domain-containing T4SS effector [Bartonella vinsonii]VEJ45899.1 Protein involved in cell division [Bartonella vinsonii]